MDEQLKIPEEYRKLHNACMNFSPDTPTEAQTCRALIVILIERLARLTAELEAKKGGWVSVKERLPIYGTWCFIVGKFGIVQKVAYARDVGEWRPFVDDADSVPDDYVTHWQPLPAAPGKD